MLSAYYYIRFGTTNIYQKQEQTTIYAIHPLIEMGGILAYLTIKENKKEKAYTEIEFSEYA